MKLTRAKAIALHRELWRRIAEAQKRGEHVRKADIIAEMGYEGVINDCFLCEFTGLHCNLCPIDWTKDGKIGTNYCFGTECSPGYYLQWLEANTRNFEKAAEIAEIIAELPEKR